MEETHTRHSFSLSLSGSVRRGSQRPESLGERVLLLFGRRDALGVFEVGHSCRRARLVALELVLDLEPGLVGDLTHQELDLVGRSRDRVVRREGPFEVTRLDVEVFKLGFKLVHDGRDLPPSKSVLERERERKEEQKKESFTLSRFMSCIARSMFLTTADMLPVTVLIVTAVSTLLATASILELNRSKFNDSFFFRIAFAA